MLGGEWDRVWWKPSELGAAVVAWVVKDVSR